MFCIVNNFFKIFLFFCELFVFIIEDINNMILKTNENEEYKSNN